MKNNADFTPDMGDYKELKPFRFWCQKVLPLVYDDSLSYYEVLCKLVEYLNKTMEDVDTLHGDVDALLNAYNQLQSYVNDYFNNLDVQDEINNKLDQMAADGTFDSILLPYFNAYTEQINEAIFTQNQSIATQRNDITVLQQRMDSYERLPEGSTTGDAELIDIRTGADGVTYSNAGSAVRGQYTELVNDINNRSILNLKFDRLDLAYLSSIATVQYNKNLKWPSSSTYLPVIQDGDDIIIDIPKQTLVDLGIQALNWTRGTSTQSFIWYTENEGAYNNGTATSILVSNISRERLCVAMNKNNPYLGIHADMRNVNRPKEILYWLRNEDIPPGEITPDKIQDFTSYRVDLNNKGVLNLKFDRVDLAFLSSVGTVQYNKNLRWATSDTHIPYITSGDDIIIDISKQQLLDLGITVLTWTRGTSNQSFIFYTAGEGAYVNNEATQVIVANITRDRICLATNHNNPYLQIWADMSAINRSTDVKGWIRADDIPNGEIPISKLKELPNYQDDLNNKGIFNIKFDRIDLACCSSIGSVQYAKKLTGYNTSTFYPVITDGDDIIIDLGKEDLQALGITVLTWHRGESNLAFMFYTPGEGAYANSVNTQIIVANMTRERICLATSKDTPWLEIWAELANIERSTDVKHWLRNDDIPDAEISPEKIKGGTTGLQLTPQIFESIGFIGDSYTGGAIVKPDSSWGTVGNRTWGQSMCRRNDITPHVYGIGGASTRTYLTTGLPLVLAGDPDDFYMFILGINDNWSLGPSYIGTIADIKPDYTDNPDTFFGNYARIIEQVQAHAPNAKFVMVKMQTHTNSWVLYNEAIEEIAEHYEIPCIDPFDDAFFTSTLYNTMVGGHPTLLGYNGMSLAYERLIANCITDNQIYFRYSGIQL